MTGKPSDGPAEKAGAQAYLFFFFFLKDGGKHDSVMGSLTEKVAS